MGWGDIIDIPTLEHAFKEIDYVYHSALISFDQDVSVKQYEERQNIVNFALPKELF
jgi:hypothetical protein